MTWCAFPTITSSCARRCEFGSMQTTRAPKRHLASEELIDFTRACPICLSSAERQAVFRVQRDPDVNLLLCSHCHGASASHFPRAEVLQSFYSSYYDGGDCHVTFSQPRRFARHLAKSLPRRAYDALTILDYGGGDGSLAAELATNFIECGRARSASIVVVDFETNAVSTRDEIQIRHQLPETRIQGPYEIVLASAILEHLPDLHDVLARLYDVIAPRGLFYARTPYALPLTHLFPRLDLTYPAHLHDLGAEFWNRFSRTFSWNAETIVSRPSIVAGDLTKDPLRTILAAVLKAPARVETWLSPRGRMNRTWQLVGGWEVLLQKQ